MTTPPPNFIVGIGGSAGALNPYKELLDALPPDTGMAFVIISHMNPTAHSHLAQILSRHTKMPVTVAAMAMPIQRDHVYVIPPNADLLIEGDTFKVVSPRDIKKKQVNLFLISLAEAMGARAIGIILSGYDGDGAEGCQRIKAKGGTTFAQDVNAEVNEMPVNAEAMGCVDFVLAPSKMAAQLRRLARTLKKGDLMP